MTGDRDTDPSGTQDSAPTGGAAGGRSGDPSGGAGGDPSGGRLGTTPPGIVVGFALVGLVLGWLVRPVSVATSGSAPTVSWLPVLALAFVAVVVGSVAWSTHRLIHRRHQRLAPHHAVNRLVLAKACSLAGALVAGGYFGYAISWLGMTEGALARERMVHSGLAGVAGVLLVVGSLLLERACRVSKDER
jgi:high-affinity Fe2+/Pb2+ permease